ncbi:MAG: hypothetical protein PWR26_746 [Methanosarcinales archaeon]|uniref:hypothetical protein n=1 Tax=Methermicoccus shengliensis TaxID=660064 RepID=UPI0005B27DB0|nr:hypothetical protein [Methermicoccus shengliensis]MDI3488029.1 hypothetical protein [Methanosarcinales archaeon]MDN5295650.1 hypothetical protein [Methanosarcinales archaeon]
MAQAKICVGKKRRRCKTIQLKSGAFPQGAFSSIERLLKVARRMVRRDGYATTIRRLNLLRVWNKSRNPTLARRCERVMERLKAEHEG